MIIQPNNKLKITKKSWKNHFRSTSGQFPVYNVIQVDHRKRSNNVTCVYESFKPFLSDFRLLPVGTDTTKSCGKKFEGESWGGFSRSKNVLCLKSRFLTSLAKNCQLVWWLLKSTLTGLTMKFWPWNLALNTGFRSEIEWNLRSASWPRCKWNGSTPL